MKNIVKIFLLTGILIPSGLLAQTRCDTLGAIVKGMLSENNETFYSNGQSYKYFLSEEEHSEIITTFYEGTTYRIATSAGLEDNYVIFEVLDQERNLLEGFQKKEFAAVTGEELAALLPIYDKIAPVQKNNSFNFNSLVI